MVNLTDYPDTECPEEHSTAEKDWLKEIFRLQKELFLTYQDIELKTLPCIVPSVIPVNLDSYEGQHQVKERIYNCITELCEAADCMKNKAWKQTMIETDQLHLIEEMVDALHFYIESCILIGLSPQDLFSFYTRKNSVNQFRQRSIY